MRASLPYFSVTRYTKANKIFKEKQQFYIAKVHEEIISAWNHEWKLELIYAPECERKGVYLAPYAGSATLF